MLSIKNTQSQIDEKWADWFDDSEWGGLSSFDDAYPTPCAPILMIMPQSGFRYESEPEPEPESEHEYKIDDTINLEPVESPKSQPNKLQPHKSHKSQTQLNQCLQDLTAQYFPREQMKLKLGDVHDKTLHVYNAMMMMCVRLSLDVREGSREDMILMYLCEWVVSSKTLEKSNKYIIAASILYCVTNLPSRAFEIFSITMGGIIRIWKDIAKKMPKYLHKMKRQMLEMGDDNIGGLWKRRRVPAFSKGVAGFEF